MDQTRPRPLNLRRRRSPVILALTLAGTLAITGLALAAPSSTVSFSFRCDGRAVANKCPRYAYQKGKLNLHTHTNYTNPGNGNPGGATKRIQIHLDNDFRFDLTATPQFCDPAQLFNRDMSAVMTGPCGPDLVGTGRGQALAGSPTFTVPACLLVFNGTPDAVPERGSPRLLIYARAQAASPPNNAINCSDPASNHQGNATVVLQGIVKQSPLGGDYRRQIDINNIDQASVFPVADLNFNLQKNDFVQARCFDANRVWNLRTKFTYNDSTTQTVNSTKTCSVG
jgi:hypothetical protein